jgi:DUF4097 and DUF4098 domain-containing protein YvlB
MMKALLLCGALVVGVTALAAVETRTAKLNFDGIAMLEVQSQNGNVAIITGEEASSLTEKREGQVEVTVTRNGATLLIKERPLQNNCYPCYSNLTIRAPINLKIKIKNSNGNFEHRGATKGIEAETSNGNATIENPGSGMFNLKSNNGELRLVGASGAINAQSGNGDVTMERIQLVASSKSRFASSNGSVEIRGLSSQGGLRISGQTANGNLSLKLPGFDVKTDTKSSNKRFTAERQGANAATLELQSDNGNISVTN